MKRIFTVALALFLVLSVSTLAFAAGEKKHHGKNDKKMKGGHHYHSSVPGKSTVKQ